MEIMKVLLSEAKEGMELANDILDEKGQLIVPFGTILDTAAIKKMENHGIVVIKVIKPSELDELFMESTRPGKSNRESNKPQEEIGYYEAIRKTVEFQSFNDNFDKEVGGLELEFNDIVLKNKEVNINKLVSGVRNIIQANKTNHSILEALDCMRGYDDLTFVHSMNVALICNMIGEWLGYTDTEIEVLTAAGLLHDIGKVKIPTSILTKPGKLTEKEYHIIKYHPIFGYEILKNQPVSIKIKNAALMHHERYDGSGYPKNLSGNQIDEVARIVAIADVYDAMTAERVYRKKLSPFDVIEYFEKEISNFDPEILLLFLQKIAQSYISSTVQLSNGQNAKVAMINNNALGRPVVITDAGAIDLSKEKDMRIISLV